MMEFHMAKIDTQIIQVFKKAQEAHLDSHIPLPMRKNLQELIDSRKDLSDRVQDLKDAIDNSWETIEKDANRILKELNQTIKKISDELN